MKTAAIALQRVAEPRRRSARRPFITQAKAEPEQTRATIGRPGDRWEREADRIADRVTGPAPCGAPACDVTPVSAARLREAQGPTAELDRMAQPKAEDQAVPAIPKDRLAEVAQPRALAESTSGKAEKEEPAQAGEGDRAQTREAPAAAKATDAEEPAQRQEEDSGPARDEEPAQAEQEEPAPPEEQAAQAQDEEPAQGQEEEAAQARQDEETAQAAEEETAQAWGAEPGGASVTAAASEQMAAARGRGAPLPPALKASLEGRFGADFSGVRIHTDSVAVQVTKALRAHAVTRGPDIFFNAGRFAPETATGAHLLAHELTHTLQQGAARPADPALQSAPELAEDGSYEVRPEVLTAIRLARAEQGKVNAKLIGPDGKRQGHERLREYFDTAMGGKKIADPVIDKIRKIPTKDRGLIDWLPSWCGIFTWWAMKKAGLPIPDWKLGAAPLDALKPRAQGELPRKGDIAIDVIPNNHFAMVTGLESTRDAEGKPVKLTRVATINGNTAGEDNLGGQVQEKWDTLSHWDHFLDPVGKLSLPPAPLVTVGRTPSEEEGTPLPEPETPAPKPEATGPKPELPAVAPPPEPARDGAPPATDLTLPPPPPAGPAEKVAKVKTADLGTSSEGAVEGYLSAAPSSMAATQPSFAGTVTRRLDGEEKALADNPPKLQVRTGGLDNIPLQEPANVAHPDGVVGDGSLGQDPGNLDPVSLPEPDKFTGNADRERELDEEDTGSFWDAFKNFLKHFTSGIRTTDGSISTDAGSAPKIDSSGEADATRMSRQRDEAGTEVTGARDKEVAAYRDHPGQASIQPVKVDEERQPALTAEPGEPLQAEADTGMADYAAAPLPANVRHLADSKIATKLAPKLLKPRTEASDAAKTRDTDKDREITTAQDAARKLSKETDAEERRLVIENRGKVAKLQGDGINEANAAAAQFGRDAHGKETEARGEIKTHVKEEQAKADKEITDGEKKAEDIKKKGEADAAAKKRELEKAQEKQSWWDRVKSAVKSAVKAITSAIDGIFNWVRKKVKEAIEWAKNAAIRLINAARNWVIDKINKFRDWAKAQVDKYLKDAFPSLAKRINGAIDAVADTAIKGVNKAADAAIAGVTALADGLTKALDKILSVFQTALKTAVRVTAAVATGDFAEALRAAIEGACEIAGIDPKPVFEFFDRAGKMVMSILKDPVPFIKNLFGAVGDGFTAFFKNIHTHLIQGVIGWLTGALAEVQLTGPFEFTVSGILKIVLQVLGLTYANIKSRVIKLYPKSAKVFDLVEKGFALVKKLVTEGPMALLDEILAKINDLKDMVLGAIRSWLITTAIKEGVVWLLSLTNPASAIVKAVKLLFDLVMFLVERYQQIKDFVLRVYEGVVAIASGNFAAVTKAVEDALARIIPVLISLFAAILGLGNIAKKVKEVIEKVTRPINKVIDAVVKKIVAFAKKIVEKAKALFGKAKKKAKAAAQKLIDWWKVKRGFNDKDGKSHTLSYSRRGKGAKLMVASDPQQIDAFLKTREQRVTQPNPPYSRVDVAAARTQFNGPVMTAQTNLENAPKVTAKTANPDVNRKLVDALQTELDTLGLKLAKLFDPGDAKDSKDFPPPKLPVMSDGARVTTSVQADYLIRGNGYPHDVKKGSESHAHTGNLAGWSQLQGAKLTRGGAKYVRMHVLPHLLGGDAVDSNLVPARGDLFNTPFSHSVEQPAIREITGKGKRWEPIWYRFKISFYPAGTTPPPTWPTSRPYPADAFPSALTAEWGHYKPHKKGQPITAGSVEKSKRDTPKLPDLSQTPAINLDGPTALMNGINQQPGFGNVTLYYVNSHLIAERQSGGKFADEDAMATRLYTNIRNSQLGKSQAAKQRTYVQKTKWAVQNSVVTMN